MRPLAALTLLALSFIAADARAGDYTCTCIDPQNRCSIRWGSSNSTRNVVRNTVLTRMQRVEYQISGGGSGHMFRGPFAVESYGSKPSSDPNYVAPEQTVRIESGGRNGTNLSYWRCEAEEVQRAPDPAPPPEPSTTQVDPNLQHGDGKTELHRAAKAGDEVYVRSLIQAGGKVTIQDMNGDTPFHLAVRYGHVAATKFILDAGADPNVVSAKDGMTPLLVALNKRNTDMVHLLLDRGARPDEGSMKVGAITGSLDLIEPQIAKGGDVQVALQVLIERKNEATLDALLARHRPNAKVTQVAASTDDLPLVERVLKAGGDANVVLEHAMGSKNAPMATIALAQGADAGPHLNDAVKMEDQALVRTMLRHGGKAQDGMVVAVNTRQQAMTALLLQEGASGAPAGLIANAAGHQDLGMMRLLLEHGADPDNGMDAGVGTGDAAVVDVLLQSGADGTRADHMGTASGAGHGPIVDLLLNAGGPAQAGMVPSSRSGHSDILVTLIESGGDPTVRDCIVGGVDGGHGEVVGVLIQHGARVDWRTGRKEETLLHLAANNQSIAVVQRLLGAGAAIDETDKNGETPLHAAGRANNNVALIQVLIDAGADINATNDKGRTVYKVANGRRNRKFFKDMGATK